MNEEKLFEIQQQARRNQADIQDYLKDLDNWTTDIKQKDVQLKKTSAEDSSLPPIRNSLEQKKKKKLRKKKNDAGNARKPAKKLSGFDFQAWDKFDVDAACAAVDEDGPKESSSDYETDEEWEEQRKLQQALLHKDQGNQLFKEGKYDGAIECYTKGIECDRNNALLPANRAMALLKQNKYAAAELDCTAAIAIDSTYVKAYSRRGTARMALKKLKEAKMDFDEVLRLEPNNKQATAEVKRIDGLLQLAKGNIKMEDGGIVKAIYKSPETRSTKPLRRMPIEEIGLEEPAQPERRPNPADSDAKFDEFLQDKKPTVFASPADIHKPQETVEIKASYPSDSFSVPTNSFHFLTLCKSLKNSPHEFYTYFKRIPSDTYVKLFGESLDADVLLQVLKTLNEFYIKNQDPVLPVLSNLSRVKRFAMTTMFMTSKDKKIIQDLFDYIQSNESISDDDMKNLKTAYSL